VLAFVGLALFFAAWPNAEAMYWKVRTGRSWIGMPSAKMYLQDPTSWRDSVATYGFPRQPGGHIVPYQTTTMLNVLWTSPEWADRDIPFVCVGGTKGELGWVEVRLQAWNEDGPAGFVWEDVDHGGLWWEIPCMAEWEVAGFDIKGGFPSTGYAADMEWARTGEAKAEQT
jgi:hypothetical protein